MVFLVERSFEDWNRKNLEKMTDKPSNTQNENLWTLPVDSSMIASSFSSNEPL